MVDGKAASWGDGFMGNWRVVSWRLRKVANRVFDTGLIDCYRCHVLWRVGNTHSTQWSRSSGTFPLCESCWSDLTIEQRIPYYDRLVDDWVKSGTFNPDYNGQSEDEVRTAMLTAVREGK